jgi:excisionase family DNA binding protein
MSPTKAKSSRSAKTRRSRAVETKTQSVICETMKIPETARVAGCGQQAIRKGIAAGVIPHLKFGRNIVIPKQAFLRFLNSAGN